MDRRQTILCCSGASREVFDVREEIPPLRLQQVHNIEPLACSLRQRPLRRQEVDVRVTAVPPVVVHVGPTPYLEIEIPLPRRDIHVLPDRLVLEPLRNLDGDATSGKPALTPAIDVCIAHVAQRHVTADIQIPRSKSRMNW